MKFCKNCGAQLNDDDAFCLMCGEPQNQSKNGDQSKDPFSQDLKGAFTTNTQDGSPVSSRSRLIAAILAWFFGWIGIHHFYLGKTGPGVLSILFCWTGIPAIVAFVNFIMILCGSEKDAEGLYVKKW